jgi:hypothetical protein
MWFLSIFYSSSLCRIWFSTACHGAESDSPLEAVVQNLNPRRCHGAESDYSLHVMVLNLIPRCMAWCWIWFPAAWHDAEYDSLLHAMVHKYESPLHAMISPLHAIVQNLIPRSMQWCRIWILVAYYGTESYIPLHAVVQDVVLHVMFQNLILCCMP